MLHFIGSFTRRLGAVVLLGAFVAGCSVSSPLTPNSSSPSVRSANGTVTARDASLANGLTIAPHDGHLFHGWISPDVKKHHKSALFYWGNDLNSTITIYSLNGTEKGEITAGLSDPERLFVDKSLNVYSSNLNNDTVTAYKRGATSPFLTISDGVSSPTGLAVDAAGTVYVANVGGPNVTEYPKGQTTPSLTLSTAPNLPEYISVDSSDNVYVAYIGSKDGVMEFPKGSKTGKDLGLDIGDPQGLAIDKAGNIITLDYDASTVDVFPPGQTQPSKQIKVTAGLPFGLSFNKAETKVYVSVQTTSNTFIVQQLAYPKGTTLSNFLTTGAGDWPLAISPDAVL